MNRLIALSAVVLVLLVVIDRVRTRQREAIHQRQSTIRPLLQNGDLPPPAVRQIQVTHGDTVWSYRYANGAWRCPEDHDALLLPDPTGRVIEEILGARGTPVSAPQRDPAHYGLDTSHRLRVHLSDAAQTRSQTVDIGRSLPGRETRESFMRAAGADTIFHVHTDPRAAFHANRQPDRPPLIDPKVLPAILERSAIAEIAYQTDRTPVRWLKRVEIDTQKTGKWRPQDGPTYEWHATIGDQTRRVSSAAVYAYLGFLRRLRYDALQAFDPGDRTPGDRIILTDATGVSDTLIIAPAAGGKAPMLYHLTARQAMLISNTRAGLLFPAEAILDSLPTPSPYDSALSPKADGSVVH